VAVSNACGPVSSPVPQINNKRSRTLLRRPANRASQEGFFDEAREEARRSSKMPKMKTKSSAKKRFKITASGKVKAAAAGKRHGMIKRTNKFIRDARGTMVLAEPDGRKVVKNYLPNGL
jgi:large subunit ribosomal protein L35